MFKKKKKKKYYGSCWRCLKKVRNMNSYLTGDRGIILSHVKRKIHPTVSVTAAR